MAATICGYDCIKSAVTKVIRDLSNEHEEDFEALLSGVARERKQDRKDHLDQGDIDFIVGRADIPGFYKAGVAKGFMATLDVAPSDGRISADEMRNGFLAQTAQPPAPPPPAAQTKQRRR